VTVAVMIMKIGVMDAVEIWNDNVGRIGGLKIIVIQILHNT
jgi:hypothetical protein